ncbi:MAG: thioredoxin reductase [Candidatus Eremiobacteraeota bacterium]|nr:thioredoxin reductase [Candidatus Eremiobacteraeota bacterium]
MITPADLAGVPLFAAIPHALRARIAARSADIRANAGEWITYEGDPAYFWTLLEGEVERVKTVAGTEVQMTTFDPGEYFGEVPLMLGTETFAAIRTLRPSRLMRTEGADFHHLLTESADAAAIIAQSLSRRVGFISDAYTAQNPTQATIVGDRLDMACHDVRDFLARNQIAFEWLDPSDPADAEFIPKPARNAQRYPVVLLADGRALEMPDNRDLARALKLPIAPRAASYDLVIVGGGPAGLAAAVYGGSEGLRTVMVEREAPGGQAGTSSRIENYLGFPGGVSGGDLAARAFQQARRFDTEILVTRWVRAIEPAAGGYAVTLDGDDVITTRAVVVAIGVTWRKLPAKGADEFVGRGIYYGAARTEALAVRGKSIFLVGGGNSAGQAAMFFSSYARTVTLLVRGDGLERTMSRYLIEQLRTKTNIAVETGTAVTRVSGGAHLERITTRTEPGGDVRERDAGALFTFIGADADTAWLPAAMERDERGYLRTGRDIEAWAHERPPFPLETSMPGIFAAGDVRSASVKRVASGVGEGSMVVAYIHQYLETLSPAQASP